MSVKKTSFEIHSETTTIDALFTENGINSSIKLFGSLKFKNKLVQEINIKVSEPIQNVIGYIISTFKNKFLLENPDIVSLTIDGTVYRFDALETESENILYTVYNGSILESDATINFKTKIGDKIKNQKVKIDLDSDIAKEIGFIRFFAPDKKDENGYPKYTKETEINKVLFFSGIGYDHPKLSKLTTFLNTYRYLIEPISIIMKNHGLKSFPYSSYLEQEFAHNKNKISKPAIVRSLKDLETLIEREVINSKRRRDSIDLIIK